MNKIPLVLVTGFLGSGKTTLLKELLSTYGSDKRIAVVQNEFADSGVDGKELKESGVRFELLEINTGSVFCICLFGGFREQLTYLIEENEPDVVILEATGLADPIAVGELFNTNADVYLSNVLCVVDAPNYERASKTALCIDNQLRVADMVIINKCDLADSEKLEQIKAQIATKNPCAEIVCTSYGKLDNCDLTKQHNISGITGELSQRNDAIISQVLRSRNKISRERLEDFLSGLTEQTIRLKGYVVLDSGESVMVQYIYGSYQITVASHQQFSTELTSLGYTEIDFSKLKV